MAGDLVNIREFEELARQVLPKMHYDYFSGGAEDEHTLRENVESFQRITFRPRILADVSNVNLASSILGYNISAPILIAPTGAHKLAHPEGEVATARAAAACNTVMVLSFSSSCAIEEVASSCNAIRFYQLYVYRRRDVSATLVERAERNGFKAIVLTADTPRMVAPKLKNLEGLLSVEVDSGEGSKLEAFASQTMDPSLSWKDIEWLKSITKLPILIKGVLTAEDGKSTVFFATMSCFVTDFTGDALVRVSTMEEGTCLPWKKELVHGRAGKLVILSSDFAARMAVEVGAAGVIVSNHGGRQLDYSPASMSVLEEVVEAVKGRVPVIVDGGVRRGTDVFKALALGAQAVMIGRPVVYGLAAKGESGVRQVIEILKDELELTMALSGCCSVKDISRSCVQTERDRLRSLL